MNIEKAKFYFGLAVLTGCIFLGVFAQRNIDQRVAAMTTDNRIVNVNASGNRIANVNVNVNASGIDPVDDLDIHIVDDRTIELTPLEFAIWLTESSGREGQIMGDNGKSRGPLQISRAAWKDAMEYDNGIGGQYEDVDTIEYAIQVFRAYWHRYATVERLGHRATANDIARIWNGGPNGFRMSSTIPYWKTISNALPTQQARR